MFSSAARGNAHSPKEISEAANARQIHFLKNRMEITSVINSTNTVPSELKRSAVLAEVITDFARLVSPLSLFSSVFRDVPLQGTNKIEVPYFPLDATASTAWNASTGYAAGNTTTSFIEIEVDKRPYQGASFTSDELNRQPFLKSVELMRQKVSKLSYDVWADVLSLVTAANYGAAAFTGPSSSFDSEDMIDLKAAVKEWPEGRRALFIDSDFDANLMKDVGFKPAYAVAADAMIRDGRLYPNIFGFNYITLPTIPSNSENLVGFVVRPEAILFAMSPIQPSPDVIRSGTHYEMVVDPATGITLEYRRFGNSVLDNSQSYVECNYGRAKGLGAALKRIVAA